MSAKIVINGRAYVGSRIEVRNGRVLVDGKDASKGDAAKDIRIVVTGDIGKLQVDACSTVKVTGSCGEVSTQSGNVECADVAGNVATMSGNVTCGRVAGGVDTMSGNITHR